MYKFSVIVFVDYGVDIKKTINYLLRNVHPRVRQVFTRVAYTSGIIETRNMHIRVMVYNPRNVIGLRANLTSPLYPELIKHDTHVPITDSDCTLYKVEQYLLRDIYDTLIGYT